MPLTHSPIYGNSPTSITITLIGALAVIVGVFTVIRAIRSVRRLNREYDRLKLAFYRLLGSLNDDESLRPFPCIKITGRFARHAGYRLAGGNAEDVIYIALTNTPGITIQFFTPTALAKIDKLLQNVPDSKNFTVQRISWTAPTRDTQTPETPAS